jgi:iron complex transport system ATP-binding protein
MNMTTPLPLESLDIRDLDVRYGTHKVVDGVSFRARAGQLAVIIGPNGSGKSSLLRAVTGELSAGGQVMMNGRPTSDLSPEEMARQRGVLAQHTTLAFPLTVAEVVRLGILRLRTSRAQIRERVLEALEKVDLDGFAPRPYHSLSGGEQQRVQLARVLCQVWEPVTEEGPRWLFLDEPVSSLDIRHQILIMDIAAGFARRGGGVVAVLHDLNLTALYADQVLAMKAGRLLADGSTREVITDGLVSQVFDHPLRVGAVPAPGMPFILPQTGGAAAAETPRAVAKG